MHPNTLGVIGITAPRFEIRFVAVHSLAYGDWLAAIGIGIPVAASNDAGTLLCLPEVKHGLAICLFVVVGGGKPLHPVAALAVRSDHAPTAGGLIASIRETDTGTDARRVRLLSDRELEPCGPGFEFCGSKAARHEILPLVSRQCPGDGGRLAWTRLDVYGRYAVFPGISLNRLWTSMDTASPSEGRGREFESRRARQISTA